MSISSTVKKVMPYLKTASGYVLHRLSSQAVEMDDGTTLEQKVTSLNSLIESKVDTSSVVNNVLTTEEGFVLDARQGKELDDKITDLNSNLMSGPVVIQNSQLTNAVNVYDGSCYQVVGNRMFFIFNIYTTAKIANGGTLNIFNIALTNYRNPKIRYIDISDSLRVTADYNIIKLTSIGKERPADTGLYFGFSIPIQKVIE